MSRAFGAQLYVCGLHPLMATHSVPRALPLTMFMVTLCKEINTISTPHPDHDFLNSQQQVDPSSPNQISVRQEAFRNSRKPEEGCRASSQAAGSTGAEPTHSQDSVASWLQRFLPLGGAHCLEVSLFEQRRGSNMG